MIIDSLENINLYKGLGTRINNALEYLKSTDFEKLENGKYEIDGNDVYAAVSRYKSKPVEEGKWEAHKDYIDVQFIASGTELIGYSFLNKMKAKTEYNPEKDVQFFEGSGQLTKVEKNTFVILFPSDAHMPGIKVNEPEDVIKVVVKVKIQ
jgi:YhcH/YjgK/YiaL family protein